MVPAHATATATTSTLSTINSTSEEATSSIFSYSHYKEAYKVGLACWNNLLSEGACVIHPINVKTVITPKWCTHMVKPESEELFKTLTQAFMRYHGSLRNFFKCNNKTYQTNCSCLNTQCRGRYADIKIEQISNAVYAFLSRIIATQKLVMKDWIWNAIAHNNFDTVGSKTR